MIKTEEDLVKDFVDYPFEKARRTSKEFTKEIAEQFSPAYFHLLGTHALENLEKMEKWFGES